MDNLNLNRQGLEQKIEEINVILNELKNNQMKMLDLIQKNHITYMKKLNKLYEYVKIDDMNNQIFEKRLCEIENGIRQLKNEKE